MQIRVEDVSPVEKKMFVEVPWETVSTKLNEAYKDLSKGVALKGFRKGKVPRPVLEQVYAPRINAEVAYQLVRESFFRANSQHKLDAVAEPMVKDAQPIKKGQPFVFEAIVEVRGDIKPTNFKGLAIEQRTLAIPEAAIDEAISALQREHTELEPVEGRETTQAGDIVGISIAGTIGEHQVNQPQFAVDIDDGEREPLPGIRAALTGIPLTAKDQKLELTVPDDYKDENLRGRKADLTFSVIEVRAKSVPALDDEFAKDTGKADTFDGLKAAIRKDLEDKERGVILREAKEGALRELIKGNQFQVASSLTERAVEIQYNRMRQMLGMKPEKGTPGLNEELRAKLRPSGADEVRGQLLLDAIADEEKIEVADAELDAHIATSAAGRNQSPGKLKAEWLRDGRLDNVRFSLRQDKVLTFLVDHATVTEVEKLSQKGAPLPGGDDADGHAHAHEHEHGPDCNH